MDKPTGAQSVDRALSLLLTIGQYKWRGATLAQLCDELGLTKPTCRRLLLALVRSELVEQVSESRRYRLGRAAYILGNFAPPHFRLLDQYQVNLLKLASRTGDTCILCVRQGDFSLAISRAEGDYPIRSHTVQPGQKFPLGVGASGTAILSTLDDEEIEDFLLMNDGYISKYYPAFDNRTIRCNVAETRRKGYFFNKGLLYKHSWGIAVPLMAPNGGAIGAIGISAVDHRMTSDHVEFVLASIRQEIATIRGV